MTGLIFGSPRRTQIRTSEWRISAERVLQRVNQDENLGDVVFSDGPFALRHFWESRLRMAPQKPWFPTTSPLHSGAAHVANAGAPKIMNPEVGSSSSFARSCSMPISGR
jgi:hypothetical protein